MEYIIPIKYRIKSLVKDIIMVLGESLKCYQDMIHVYIFNDPYDLSYEVMILASIDFRETITIQLIDIVDSIMHWMLDLIPDYLNTTTLAFNNTNRTVSGVDIHCFDGCVRQNITGGKISYNITMKINMS